MVGVIVGVGVGECHVPVNVTVGVFVNVFVGVSVKVFHVPVHVEVGV